VQALHLGGQGGGRYRLAGKGDCGAQALLDVLDVGGVVRQRGGTGQQCSKGQDGFAAGVRYSMRAPDNGCSTVNHYHQSFSFGKKILNGQLSRNRAPENPHRAGSSCGASRRYARRSRAR
jgi:hypothetical protein